MTNRKPILVVIDPTAKEQPALARAAWIARKLSADLELFICDYDQYLAGDRFFDSRALEKARASVLERHRKRLNGLAAPLRDEGIDVSIDAVWDHPLHEGLLRKIESSNPRFVFKDTHYHSAIRRSLFSNTDWHLIRECNAPLWLVKPHETPAITNLLAAVDPMHERDKPALLDHKIISTGTDICKATGAELSIVHAFDPAPIYAVSTDAMSFPITEPINETINELKAQHQVALQELTRERGIDTARCHLMDGDARDVLVGAVTELAADVVIIGAVARGALKRLALGSTAERVLDFVPCDLLIVKPDRSRT